MQHAGAPLPLPVQSMAVCPFSEQTLFSALALRRLGREEVRGRSRENSWTPGCMPSCPPASTGYHAVTNRFHFLHFSILAPQEAHALLERLLEHAQALAESQARVDYFATSLPTMLLFHDDLQERQVRGFAPYPSLPAAAAGCGHCNRLCLLRRALF